MKLHDLHNVPQLYIYRIDSHSLPLCALLATNCITCNELCSSYQVAHTAPVCVTCLDLHQLHDSA